MERARVDGITLEYEEAGNGEPVVFIHGALVADVARPLLSERSLADGRRLVAYRRRGYGGSSKPDGPVSVSQQAADCLALMRHLGLERAHLVGHSLGGCIALQVALDAPSAVRSLALLEPALAIGSTGEAYRESLASATRQYHELETPALVDRFMEARSPGYEALLERRLPGAFDAAVADAPTTFEVDIPALLEWTFTETDARRVEQPVLTVLGGDSDALWSRFGEVHRLLLERLPNAEGFELPGATHFMQLERPAELAEMLAAFFGRHGEAPGHS